jgi:plastocyanin
MQRLMLSVAVAMFVVVACGGDDPEASGTENNDIVVVAALDNEFDPATITAATGTSLEVSNEGEAPHNFSVAGSDIDVDIEPGESVTVDTAGLAAGSHAVECKFHSGAGMTATLSLE